VALICVNGLADAARRSNCIKKMLRQEPAGARKPLEDPKADVVEGAKMHQKRHPATERHYPELLSDRPAATATQANACQIGRCAAAACRWNATWVSTASEIGRDATELKWLNGVSRNRRGSPPNPHIPRLDLGSAALPLIAALPFASMSRAELSGARPVRKGCRARAAVEPRSGKSGRGALTQANNLGCKAGPRATCSPRCRQPSGYVQNGRRRSALSLFSLSQSMPSHCAALSSRSAAI